MPITIFFQKGVNAMTNKPTNNNLINRKGEKVRINDRNILQNRNL